MATIHCLRNGHTASAELSDDQLAELEVMVRSVAADMLAITEDTEIDPVHKSACGACNYYRICERRARILGEDWKNHPVSDQTR